MCHAASCAHNLDGVEFKMSDNEYSAKSLEVLKGLDPVKKRPGMYTNTDRPNHLAAEIIDNSVDEAISGYADKIIVTMYKDNSMLVEDKTYS